MYIDVYAQQGSLACFWDLDYSEGILVCSPLALDLLYIPEEETLQEDLVEVSESLFSPAVDRSLQEEPTLCSFSAGQLAGHPMLTVLILPFYQNPDYSAFACPKQFWDMATESGI